MFIVFAAQTTAIFKSAKNETAVAFCGLLNVNTGSRMWLKRSAWLKKYDAVGAAAIFVLLILRLAEGASVEVAGACQYPG